MRLPILFACCAGALTLQAGQPLRLVGSTTVRGALEPKQHLLEEAIGRQIEFSGSGSIAGLLSLVAGSGDVAMLSVSLEEAARMLNARTPGIVDTAALHAEQIGEARTIFIVNPRNSVRLLSSQQLADVLAGRVQNWQQVGGSDANIVVVSLANGGSLLEPLLKGAPIAVTARKVPDASRIPMLVAQEPNAIGIISATHARGETTVLQTDVAIAAPLYLVTKGNPDAAVSQLVLQARAALQ